MIEILSELLPPVVMAGVVIAFVVWLYRSQLAKKDDEDDAQADRKRHEDDGNE